MDYSQYLRIKNEAANVYVARSKTVDSSFLTHQKRQRAAYSGYNTIQSIPYYNGAPVVNNSVFDTSNLASPKDHQFTQGFTATNRLSQQEDQAFRKGGAAVCGDPSYSILSPGIQLQNSDAVNTILTSFSNSPAKSAPGQPKPYGYGIAHYFPNPQLNCSTCQTCDTPLSFPSA